MTSFFSGLQPGSWADWATAILATLALVGSLIAVFLSRRSEKRQLFIQLHDRLTSDDAQYGRRLLFQQLGTDAAISRMFRRRPHDFDQVNRALGLYNTLGIYAHRGYLDKNVVLDQWGQRIAHGWPHIERFLRWRRTQANDPRMWPHLVWLAEKSGAEISADMRLENGWHRR